MNDPEIFTIDCDHCGHSIEISESSSHIDVGSWPVEIGKAVFLTIAAGGELVRSIAQHFVGLMQLKQNEHNPEPEPKAEGYGTLYDSE